MHFHQHRHAEPVRNVFEFGHARIIERGSDQQDAIGPQRAGLINLVGLDHEILAQHRQRASGTRFFQVVTRALKKIAVGQHRQTGRAVFFIAERNRRRIERVAQQALAGAGLLDFRNHRRPAGGDTRAHGTGKITRPVRGCRCQFDRGEVADGHRRRHFGLLDGKNTLKDIAHGFKRSS